MIRAFPTGLVLCLLGASACAGIALWTAWKGFRGRRPRLRLAALATGERATAIVEFPFALIVFLIFTLLAWQLFFLAAAYTVLDYSAYAAVRAAIVIVPEDRDAEGKDEGENKVADVKCGLGSGKGGDLREAAAFVIYPIAGNYASPSAWGGDLPVIGDISKFLPGDALKKLSAELDIATRYVYALFNTEVRLVTDDSKASHEFEGGELLTVEVTHDYSLRVPFADRILGHMKLISGYVTTVTVSASMINEGFGPEAEPEGAGGGGGGGKGKGGGAP